MSDDYSRICIAFGRFVPEDVFTNLCIAFLHFRSPSVVLARLLLNLKGHQIRYKETDTGTKILIILPKTEQKAINLMPWQFLDR